MVNLDAILFKEFKCVASFKLKTSSQEEIDLHAAKFKSELENGVKNNFSNLLAVINKDMIK